MQKVESGVLLNLLAGLIGAVDSALGKLQDIGLEVKDKKEDKKDGSIIYEVVYNDEEEDQIFYVKCIPDRYDDSVCTLRIKDDKQSDVVEKLHCRVEDIDKYIEKYIEDNYGYSSHSREQTNSSTKFQATFQRIVGSKDDTIQLTAIRCGTATADMVLQNVDALLDSSDFVAEIAEEPTSFEIIDDGTDDLDVTPIESLEEDTTPIHRKALIAAYQLYNTLSMCKFNVSGIDRDVVCSMCDYSEYSIRDQIQELSKLHVKQDGYCLSPASILKDIPVDRNTLTVDVTSAMTMIQADLKEYIATLELLYVDYAKGMQNKISQWLSGWEDLSSYDIPQKLK